MGRLKEVLIQFQLLSFFPMLILNMLPDQFKGHLVSYRPFKSLTSFYRNSNMHIRFSLIRAGYDKFQNWLSNRLTLSPPTRDHKRIKVNYHIPIDEFSDLHL